MVEYLPHPPLAWQGTALMAKHPDPQEMENYMDFLKKEERSCGCGHGEGAHRHFLLGTSFCGRCMCQQFHSRQEPVAPPVPPHE